MSEKAVYAIVGRGYGAAVNFATLRLTSFGRNRLGDCPVLFIGDVDPWQSFRQHKMGQHPALMTLPGFCIRPRLHPREHRNYLSSKEFARVIREQYAKFKEVIEHDFLQGTVTHIRGDGSELVLTVRDGSSDQKEVRAAYVDICTGIGKPDHPPAITKTVQDDLDDLLTSGRLWLGGSFLQECDLQIKDKEVCIIGGGPVSSLCCELALEQKARRVVWVANDRFPGAFPPGGRFDELRAGITSQGYPIPANPTLQIAADYNAEVTNANPLTVSFTEVAPDAGRSYDHAGNWRFLNDAHFDAVVIATGFQNDIEMVTKSPVWEPLYGLVSFPVGAHAYDEKLRLLGAAALTHPKLALGGGFMESRYMKNEIDCLNQQLEVPVGKPYCIGAARCSLYCRSERILRIDGGELWAQLERSLRPAHEGMPQEAAYRL